MSPRPNSLKNKKKKTYSKKIGLVSTILDVDNPNWTPKTRKRMRNRAGKRLKRIAENNFKLTVPPTHHSVPLRTIKSLYASPDSYKQIATTVETKGKTILDIDDFLLDSNPDTMFSINDIGDNSVHVKSESSLAIELEKIFSHWIFSTILSAENVMTFQEIVQYLVDIRTFCDDCILCKNLPFSQYPIFSEWVRKGMYPKNPQGTIHPKYESVLETINQVCIFQKRMKSKYCLWFQLMSFLLHFHGISKAGVKVLRMIVEVPSHDTFLRFKKLLSKSMDDHIESLKLTRMIVMHFDNHQLANIRHTTQTDEKQSKFFVMLAGSCASVPDSMLDGIEEDPINVVTFGSMNSKELFKQSPSSAQKVLDFEPKLSKYYQIVEKFKSLKSLKISSYSEVAAEIPLDFLQVFPAVEPYDIKKMNFDQVFYTRPMVFGSPNKATCDQMVSEAMDERHLDIHSGIGLSTDLRPRKSSKLETWKKLNAKLYDILLQVGSTRIRSVDRAVTFSGLSREMFVSKALNDIPYFLSVAVCKDMQRERKN